MIDVEKAKATLAPLETQTGIKAWMLQVGKKFYQIIPYSIVGLGEYTGVWECNSKGKRKGKDKLFMLNIKNHNICADKFLETLVAAEAATV